MICLKHADGLSARALLEDLRLAWRRNEADFKVQGDANVGIAEAEGFRLAVLLIPGPMPTTELELPARAAWYWPGAGESAKMHTSHLIVTAEHPRATPRDIALFHARALASLVARVPACALLCTDTKLLLDPVQYRKAIKDSAAAKRIPAAMHVGVFCAADGDGTLAYTVGLRKFSHAELEVRAKGTPPAALIKFLLAVCDHIVNSGAAIQEGESVGHAGGFGGVAEQRRSSVLANVDVLRIDVAEPRGTTAPPSGARDARHLAIAESKTLHAEPRSTSSSRGEPPPVAVPTRDLSGYRDLSTITSVVNGLFGVGIVLALLGLWFNWIEIQILQRAMDGSDVSEAEALASDSRLQILSWCSIPTYLTTAVCFLVWTFKTKKNARSLGATDMKYSPGWSVGWYFVPIATLWKPYQALKETFMASHPDYRGNWQAAPGPAILPVWWLLWLASNILGQWVFRTSLRADTLEEYLQASWVSLYAQALDLPLCICAIMVVGTLYKWQKQSHQGKARAIA